jgi:hypothetical protein
MTTIPQKAGRNHNKKAKEKQEIKNVWQAGE